MLPAVRPLCRWPFWVACERLRAVPRAGRQVEAPAWRGCPDASSQVGQRDSSEAGRWRHGFNGLYAWPGRHPSMSGSLSPHLCTHMCMCTHTHTLAQAPGWGSGEGQEMARRAEEVTPCSCSSGPWVAAGCLWALQGEPRRAWPWPWPARPSSFLQWQRPPASGWGRCQGVGGCGLPQAL